MAKIIQQLDLFGMPMENPAPPKKTKQPAKNTSASKESFTENPPPVQTPSIDPIKEAIASTKVEDSATISTLAPDTDSIANTVSTPIVYSNEQIIVKIKPVTGSKEPVKTETKRGRKSFKEINATADLIDIPDDETLQKKLYYSISEVAAWFKVNTSLLRYWENEFDILQPRKTRKGDRLFRVEDIKNLELIYFLLRQRKFSIEGAKSYLKNNKSKIDTETQLVKTLTDFKVFLLELKSSLNPRS
jgi:DNA-binding transcriptional MerR regulator